MLGQARAAAGISSRGSTENVKSAKVGRTLPPHPCGRHVPGLRRRTPGTATTAGRQKSQVFLDCQDVRFDPHWRPVTVDRRYLGSRAGNPRLMVLHGPAILSHWLRPAQLGLPAGPVSATAGQLISRSGRPSSVYPRARSRSRLGSLSVGGRPFRATSLSRACALVLWEVFSIPVKRPVRTDPPVRAGWSSPGRRFGAAGRPVGATDEFCPPVRRLFISG